MSQSEESKKICREAENFVDDFLNEERVRYLGLNVQQLANLKGMLKPNIRLLLRRILTEKENMPL